MARGRSKVALAGAWFCMLMAAAPVAMASSVFPPSLSRVAGSRTITTGNGTWIPAAGGYAYAWFRCTSVTTASCVQVPGASAASYVLRTADIGFRIRSRVTDTGGGGSRFSEPPTDPIAASPPVNTVRPVLSGKAQVTLALGTTPGTWSGRVAGDPPFGYQWQRCTSASSGGCSNISGATGTTYVLGPRDAGRFIRPVIQAEGLGAAAAVPSRFAGPVQAVPPAARLRPFPVLVIAGVLRGSTTRLNEFVVRGPRRAKVSIRCKGRRCPFRRIGGTIGRRKRLRFRRAQRTFRAGQVLEIRVTGRNRIGKFTSNHLPPWKGAAAIRFLPAAGGQRTQPLPGGLMRARLALLALAAAAAFLGTYAVGQADGDSAPAKDDPPVEAALPASKPVPVPATARLPGLRAARAGTAAPAVRTRRPVAVSVPRSVQAAPAPAPAPAAPKPKPSPGTPFFNAR